MSSNLVRKRFESADRILAFRRGEFRLVSVGGTTVGESTYPPGWRWSVDAGAADGQRWCEVEHVVVVVSGRLMVQFRDGTEVPIGPGDIAYVSPGHDSWVLGDEPYVSIHLRGATQFSEGRSPDRQSRGVASD